MLSKKVELQKAINLRHKGKSYSEIAGILHVSKSTLSLWLRNINLEEESQKILKRKKYEGQLKGGLARKNFRIQTQRDIELRASGQIGFINKREFWLLG